jgi:membrane fusion protein, adhesin transport system
MSHRAKIEFKDRVRLLFDPGVIAINQAIELEERPPAKIASRIVYAVCGLIAGALLWSAFTNLDIVASGAGQVSPSGELVAIQHVDGGIVAEILVPEGEHVVAGQTLVRLVPLDNQGRLEQVMAKRAAHLLAIESERAIVEGRTPNYAALVAGFQDQKHEQLSYYTAKQLALKSSASVLSQQIEQRRNSVRRHETQLPVLERDEERALAELARSKTLFDRQLTTRDTLYRAEREAADREKIRLETRDELARARNELAEYEHRLADLDARSRAEARESIATHTADLEEVEAQIGAERAREARLNVNAPVAGFVNNLTVKAINAVVKPGETMMEIVPTEEPLVVLANVAPQDIAYVTAGQPADVRVTAFDYSMFGTLPGNVERISPSTYVDSEGRPFYRVYVKLERDYFGNDPKFGRVAPGMEAQVDVKTGSRSVMSYLLKPVVRTWDTALRER